MKYNQWKLFIDDERYPVEDDKYLIIIARTSHEAIQLCEKHGLPTEIMFDHDLGGDDTSIKFINWLEEALISEQIQFPEVFTYSIHSQNPIGSINIKSKMDNLIKYFK